MTQPDFRAELQLLVNASNSTGEDLSVWWDAVDRAEAALATPLPEPPADGEVAELVALIRQIAFAWELDGLRPVTASQLVRAAELLERTATPPPEPPTDEELIEIARELRKTAEYLQLGCGWDKALRAIESAANLIEGDLLKRLAPPITNDYWRDKIMALVKKHDLGFLHNPGGGQFTNADKGINIQVPFCDYQQDYVILLNGLIEKGEHA